MYRMTATFQLTIDKQNYTIVKLHNYIKEIFDQFMVQWFSDN